MEIGSIIAGEALGRSADDQITVFDSTGVAVQDIMIARGVYEASPADGDLLPTWRERFDGGAA